MEYFDVLDAAGNKTGETVERTEAHRLGVCHRSVMVWIMNAKNQLLMQKRCANKDIGASLWYVSMGGHLVSGESNERAIERELQEELGLGAEAFMDKIRYLYTFQETCTYKGGAVIDSEFCDVYLLRMEVDLNTLVLQKEEVAAVKWVDYAEFKAAVLDNDPAYLIHTAGFATLLTHLEVAGKNVKTNEK